MRILIVRIGRAGDIVMTTPALSAIIDCYPNAKITFLTSPDGPRLLKNYHQNLEDIWIWNRSGILAYFNKRKIIKKLNETRFDIIFCFETSKNISRMFSGLKSELFQNNHVSKDRHSSANYLDVVKQACPSMNDNYYAHLPVSADAIKNIDTELSAIGISADDTVIMLHPTFSGYSSNPLIWFFSKKYRKQAQHRLWPVTHFSELGIALSKLPLTNGKKPKVIIDLIPDEAELGEKIIKNTQGEIQLLLAPPNFERYKALIKRANLLVTPNTGPLHVAAAVDTKIVALFSGWDPLDCGPFMKHDRFITLRAEDTANPDDGLASIVVSSVLSACKKFLLTNQHE